MSADQGTPEWLAERCGFITASRMADVLATTKTGEAATRANYRAELVAQRLTGQIPEGFTNAAMQWGTEQEPFARATYEIQRGVIVQEVGFIHHPTIAMSGASPDGLVDDGLVEIKCPNTATHIATLRGGGIDRKYILQMQWQMACTERDWCDFVSFDPRLPSEMQLHVQRIERDAALLAEIEAEVTAFLAEIDEAVADLRARYMEKEAA